MNDDGAFIVWPGLRGPADEAEERESKVRDPHVGPLCVLVLCDGPLDAPPPLTALHAKHTGNAVEQLHGLVTGRFPAHLEQRQHLCGVDVPQSQGSLGVVGQNSATLQSHQETPVDLRHVCGPVLVTLPLGKCFKKRENTRGAHVKQQQNADISEDVNGKLTLPFSTSLVIMTTTPTFCSQIIRQKSSVLDFRGP